MNYIILDDRNLFNNFHIRFERYYKPQNQKQKPKEVMRIQETVSIQRYNFDKKYLLFSWQYFCISFYAAKKEPFRYSTHVHSLTFELHNFYDASTIANCILKLNKDLRG